MRHVQWPMSKTILVLLGNTLFRPSSLFDVLFLLGKRCDLRRSQCGWLQRFSEVRLFHTYALVGCLKMHVVVVLLLIAQSFLNPKIDFRILFKVTVTDFFVVFYPLGQNKVCEILYLVLCEFLCPSLIYFKPRRLNAKCRGLKNIHIIYFKSIFFLFLP